MAEPTSALSFEALIIEVAQKMGVAYYGSGGDEAAQIPQDAHDLAECKRHVNNGIRMFINDAPPNGWRWMRPTLSLTYWGAVTVDDDVTVASAYEPSTDTTLVTASEDSFYPSMESKTIVVTDVDSYTIATYVSATEIRLSGDVHWSGSKTFAIASSGNFTLPKTFGGQYIGPITFAAGTNTGARLDWTSEAEIRKLREDSTTETGDPRLAAVRRLSSDTRRWELMLYPEPDEEDTVEFTYDLYFDSLTALTDLHPAGYAFDETVKAAVMAAMERDAEDVLGGLTQYYTQRALPNAYKIDARSAPRKLGYFGNRQLARRLPIQVAREYIERPTVTFNS